MVPGVTKKLCYPIISSEHIFDPVVVVFDVVCDAKESLLCYDTSVKLKLVTVTNAVVSLPLNIHNIVNKFPDRFQGIGCYNGGTVHLHINPDIIPVSQPHRRQPFHTRKKS